MGILPTSTGELFATVNGITTLFWPILSYLFIGLFGYLALALLLRLLKHK